MSLAMGEMINTLGLVIQKREMFYNVEELEKDVSKNSIEWNMGGTLSVR